MCFEERQCFETPLPASSESTMKEGIPREANALESTGTAEDKADSTSTTELLTCLESALSEGGPGHQGFSSENVSQADDRTWLAPRKPWEGPGEGVCEVQSLEQQKDGQEHAEQNGAEPAGEQAKPSARSQKKIRPSKSLKPHNTAAGQEERQEGAIALQNELDSLVEQFLAQEKR